MSQLPLASRRPRLSPQVARRIDRLARGAHAFHRFAHHPLCERYRTELIPLGRRARLCRGCTFLAAGLSAGLAIGLSVSRPVFGALPWAAPLVAAVLALSPVRTKVAKRFLPGLLFASAAVMGPWPLAVLTAAVGAVVFAVYRVRGPNRSPCTGCPERSLEVCSGFRPLVRRERALVRLTRPLLVSKGA